MHILRDLRGYPRYNNNKESSACPTFSPLQPHPVLASFIYIGSGKGKEHGDGPSRAVEVKEAKRRTSIEDPDEEVVL